MKKILLMIVLAMPTIANAFENPQVIYGKECSINTKDSHGEAGGIGRTDIYFEVVRLALISKIKANNFNYVNESMKQYYFKDFEFLIELEETSGRGSSHSMILSVIRTGKYGDYEKVFYLEQPFSSDPEVEENMIKQIPKCVKLR